MFRRMIVAAGLAALVLGGPAAHATVADFSINDPLDDVNITGSITFTSPDDSVENWSQVSAFVISFTPYGTSPDPAATFTLADFPTIEALNPPNSSETIRFCAPTTTNSGCFFPSLDIGVDSESADQSQYAGFFVQTVDGGSYQYGVQGTLYSGPVGFPTINETDNSVPEPATLGVLAIGLLGIGCTRLRRRHTV